MSKHVHLDTPDDEVSDFAKEVVAAVRDTIRAKVSADADAEICPKCLAMALLNGATQAVWDGIEDPATPLRTLIAILALQATLEKIRINWIDNAAAAVANKIGGHSEDDVVRFSAAWAARNADALEEIIQRIDGEEPRASGSVH